MIEFMVDEQRLADIRQRIDDVDKKLVELLNERARLALEAGFAKGGQNIQRPERELEVIRNVVQNSRGPLSSEGIEAIFRTIIKVCRTIQLTK
jgi:chorismate mutase/prephenate dehydratase